ncbi:MAG TPA: ice-binding family protein [Polyangia bacterium]|nr:ice-binding family protein [Polyangia bacterium]
MNRKAIVLTRLAAVVLLIGILAAGCAMSGASASGSTSPTSTAPSSQSASEIPTPIDSAAPSATVVTGPTSTAEATNAPAPTAAGPASVDLGTAGNYVLLSKAGISTTGTTKVTGSIAVSPIAASAITGFGLVLDKSRTFSTSTLVTGRVYAANYAAPTPSVLTTAVKDMQTAYTNAAGRAADATGLGAGNIGGLTLAPGVYKWGTGVTIPTNVALSGGENDVWIFQIAGTLSISSAKQVILEGGAQAKNVFWQVAGATTLGTNSTFNGNILDKKNIALRTGAVLNGRALAQTAITLEANRVN